MKSNVVEKNVWKGYDLPKRMSPSLFSSMTSFRHALNFSGFPKHKFLLGFIFAVSGFGKNDIFIPLF